MKQLLPFHYQLFKKKLGTFRSGFLLRRIQSTKLLNAFECFRYNVCRRIFTNETTRCSVITYTFSVYLFVFSVSLVRSPFVITPEHIFNAVMLCERYGALNWFKIISLRIVAGGFNLPIFLLLKQPRFCTTSPFKSADFRELKNHFFVGFSLTDFNFGKNDGWLIEVFFSSSKLTLD